MVNAYFYSNTALPTTLSGSISSGATSITVGATTGFPGSLPYVLALDYGAGTEELVSVSGVAGLTLTVSRGFSGTSAQSHSLGAVVRHVYHAGDATDFRTHEAAVANAHGVTGNLVGDTQAQTLTNKTLTSPTINGGALSGTFTGAHTYSGAVTQSGGGTMSGTFTGTPTFSGNVTHSGEIILSNLLRGSRATASDSMYESRVTADANARWFSQTDGKLWWGPGTAAVDTNLYRSAANTLATDDSLTVGGNLTVTGTGRVLTAYKTSDTSRASTTTLTADPALTLAVVANATYVLEGVLFYSSASVTPDLQMTIDGPASTGGMWALSAPSAGSTSDPDAVRVVASAIAAGRGYGVPVAGSVFSGILSGTIETAGTAGDVAVWWSQFVSNATSTTMKAYSWIRLTRVA
jgi:hypothetical protein